MIAAMLASARFPAHTFVCEGVTIEDEVFVGTSRRDVHQRHRGTLRRTADGRPQTEADWKVIPTAGLPRCRSIGSGAVILCGVTIGAGQPWSGPAPFGDARRRAWAPVVAGVPARLLRASMRNPVG